MDVFRKPELTPFGGWIAQQVRQRIVVVAARFTRQFHKPLLVRLRVRGLFNMLRQRQRHQQHRPVVPMDPLLQDLPHQKPVWIIG